MHKTYTVRIFWNVKNALELAHVQGRLMEFSPFKTRPRQCAATTRIAADEQKRVIHVDMHTLNARTRPQHKPKKSQQAAALWQLIFAACPYLAQEAIQPATNPLSIVCVCALHIMLLASLLPWIMTYDVSGEANFLHRQGDLRSRSSPLGRAARRGGCGNLWRSRRALRKTLLAPARLARGNRASPWRQPRARLG